MVSAITEGLSSTELESTPVAVKRYQRQKLAVSIGSLVVSLVALLILGLWAGPRLDSLARQWLGEGRWWRLIVLAGIYAGVMEILTLPFDFWSGFILEHRYQLSNLTLRGWVWRRLKGYLIGAPIGLVLLLGLYTLFWYAGSRWWAWAALGWLAVSLLLGQLLPVVILPLFYKVTRLDDPGLLERLRHVADGTGLNVEGVYRLQLSTETRKANAALTGLGRTRRVLLGDTLLDRFTPEEIEVVFAHEVGHHVHHHLPKIVASSVVLTGLGLWLVNVFVQYAAGNLGYVGTEQVPAYKDPAALPLLLLVLSLFGLVLMPAKNAVSRFFERQCDRYALERTGMSQAYRSAFVKLARINKADPDPNPLEVWFFDDHPPIRQRLAMADAIGLVRPGKE